MNCLKVGNTHTHSYLINDWLFRFLKELLYISKKC